MGLKWLQENTRKITIAFIDTHKLLLSNVCNIAGFAQSQLHVRELGSYIACLPGRAIGVVWSQNGPYYRKLSQRQLLQMLNCVLRQSLVPTCRQYYSGNFYVLVVQVTGCDPILKVQDVVCFSFPLNSYNVRKCTCVICHSFLMMI